MLAHRALTTLRTQIPLLPTTTRDIPKRSLSQDQRRTSSTTTAHGTTTTAHDGKGLLGINGLTHHNGWIEYAQSSATKALSIVDAIIKHGDTLDPSVLLRMTDLISMHICAVCDPAELVRSTAPEPALMQSADSAYQIMSQVIERLNTDHKLYSVLKKRIFETPGAFDGMTPSYQHFAKVFIREFENNGIHLPAKERAVIADLRNQLQNGVHQYTIESEKELFHKFLVPTHLLTIPKHKNSPLHSWGRKKSAISASECEGIWGTMSDPSARKQLYEHITNAQWAGTGGGKGLEALEHLLQVRHSLAQKLGFSSYAEMTLQENVVKSPVEVMHFLKQSHNRNRSKAQKEYDTLLAEKYKLEGSCEKIYTYDLPYYKNRVRSSLESYDKLKEESTEYFELDNCIDGLNIVSQKVFGLSLVAVPLASGESWHPEVFKMAVTSDDDQSTKGYIYFDLFERPNKVQVSSHYTITLGHKLHVLPPRLLNLDHSFSTNHATSHNGLYTIPKVAISTGFSPYSMSLTDVTTLFHEFGHCLHSIISQSEFQHLAGTRGPFDFVELPSTLFERFARHWDILKLFAKHKTSGQPLPFQLYEKLMNASKMFEGLDDLESITMSVLDQRLHGPWDGKTLNQANIKELTHDTFSEFGIVNTTPSGVIPFPAYLSHFGNYGSQYYSYHYVATLQQATWSKLFHAKPLSRSAGTLFARTILAPGCSRNYHQTIKDLLGSFPSDELIATY